MARALAQSNLFSSTFTLHAECCDFRSTVRVPTDRAVGRQVGALRTVEKHSTALRLICS